MALRLAPNPLEVRLPARRWSVTTARHQVVDFLKSLGAESDDVELAVDEAVANAVEHAFRGLEDGTILLRVETLVPDTLAVTVSDDGVGFGPDPARRGLGLGLALIGKLSSAFEITPRAPGTRVQMRFPIRQLPGDPLERSAAM
jgi:anti-sigma regulatory factor (Ser/Thr protein kinase)